MRMEWVLLLVVAALLLAAPCFAARVVATIPADLTYVRESATLDGESMTDSGLDGDGYYYNRSQQQAVWTISTGPGTTTQIGLSVASVNPSDYIEAPTNLTGEYLPPQDDHGPQFVLRWTDNASNELLYNVEKRGPGGNWRPARRLPRNSTSWTYEMSGSVDPTLLWWRVYAINRTTRSAYSDELHRGIIILMPDSGTRANTQERIYYTTASSITLSGVAGFDGPVKYVVGANHTTGDGILCTVVVSAGRTLWVSDPIALNLGPNSIEMYAAPESGDPVRDRDVITVWRLLPDATNTIPFTEYVHDEFVRQIDTDLFAWATPQQPDPDLSFWFENEMGDVAGFATSLPLYWDRGDGWHQKLYDPWDRRFCVYGKVFRQGPISAWEYELGGSALPDSMTLLRESAFGDEDSRFIDGILLDSGAVVVAWNHGFELPVQDFAALVGVSYLPPDRSEWQTIYPIQVPGAGCDIVSMRGALAQHPVDGSVWLFAVRDASGRISAIHFTETDSGLVLDWVERDFLAKPDGFLAPDGERCCIRAVADSWRGVIQVVYVTNAAQYVIDGTGTTRVGPVALTQVAADGQTTGTLSPLFTPRLLSGAMLAREEGVYLAGVAYPSGTLDLHLWDGEDWSVATTLGPAQLDGPVIDWTSTVPYPDALARAIVARMADGQVHTYVIGGDDG